MHYSDAQSMAMLQAWAVNAAESFTRFPAGYVPLLVYTGMSGISHATALAMELHRRYPKIKFDMAYVRKVGEKSHGEPIETTVNDNSKNKFLAVFVDDFVDTGASFKRCMREIMKMPFSIKLHHNGDVVYCINGYKPNANLVDYAVKLSDKKKR